MLLVIPFGGLQALGHEVNVPLGGPNAVGRLLLKRMKDVNRLLEPNRVDGSIRISVVRFDDFQHAWPEPLPRLCRRRRSAELRDPKGVSHVVLDRSGEAEEVTLRGSNPVQRLLGLGQRLAHSDIIPVLGYSYQALGAPE